MSHIPCQFNFNDRSIDRNGFRGAARQSGSKCRRDSALRAGVRQVAGTWKVARLTDDRRTASGDFLPAGFRAGALEAMQPKRACVEVSWSQEKSVAVETDLVTFAEFARLPDPPSGHLELRHGEVFG